MKKIRKTYATLSIQTSLFDSLPTIQISLGIITIFDKIYYGEPVFTFFSNIGEDVQYRCFNKVNYVKSVLQPDTKALLGNNYILHQFA
jgi:hypothetical protein